MSEQRCSIISRHKTAPTSCIWRHKANIICHAACGLYVTAVLNGLKLSCPCAWLHQYSDCCLSHKQTNPPGGSSRRPAAVAIGGPDCLWHLSHGATASCAREPQQRAPAQRGRHAAQPLNCCQQIIHTTNIYFVQTLSGFHPTPSLWTSKYLTEVQR